jgi:hypothetical protein
MSRTPLRLAAAALLAVPVAAGAQISLPLPPVGSVPEPVGGVVTQTTTAVQDAVGQVLGGGLPQLPTGTVDQLLGSLGVPGLDGLNGAAGQPGTLPDGTILADARAPVLKVKVLSTVRQISMTRKLRVQISSDEAGVVAIGGSIRPGAKRRLATRKARSQPYSRKPIRFPAMVLGFRKAGALTVTVRFPRAAKQTLGRGRNARISVALAAVDVARNQGLSHVKRIVKR